MADASMRILNRVCNSTVNVLYVDNATRAHTHLETLTLPPQKMMQCPRRDTPESQELTLAPGQVLRSTKLAGTRQTTVDILRVVNWMATPIAILSTISRSKPETRITH